MLTPSFRAEQAFQDVRERLAGVQTQMGSLTFAMPQDVADLRAVVEQVLAAVTAVHEAMERQMQAERAARVERESAMLTQIEAATSARIAAEQQLAEAKTLLAAAQNAPRAAPASEPADFKLNARRGADGKIDLDSVVIQRIPRK